MCKKNKACLQESVCAAHYEYLSQHKSWKGTKQNKADHFRVTAFYTRCHGNRCNMANCVFLEISTSVSRP